MLEKGSSKSLILFLLLYVSNDTILFGTNSNNSVLFVRLSILTTIVLLMLSYFFVKNIKFKKNHIILLITFIALITLTGIWHGDLGRFAYFHRIFSIISGFVCAYYISFDEFTKIYDKVMLFICSISLIGYIAELLSLSFYKLFPVITNIANVSYYNLFFTMIITRNDNIPRNYSFFREPGVFQMFVIIALIIHLFMKEEKKYITIIIYVLTVLTTRSTTGYIALFLIGFTFFIDTSVGSINNKIKIFLSLLFVPVFSYLYTQTDVLIGGTGSVFGETLEETGSYLTRVGGMVVNLYMFYLNPIFGLGVTKSANRFPDIVQTLYNTRLNHNTNNTLVQFSKFGLLFGLMWNLGYLKLVKVFSRKWFIKLLIFIIINVLFVGEDVSLNIVFTMLMFYGFFTDNRFRETKLAFE